MNAIGQLLATILLLVGSGYAVKSIHNFIQRAAIERIQNGLSSSEKLAQQLTGKKLDF